MAAPLTNGQKAYLAQLSERAFNRTAALARGRGETVADGWRERGTWRHEQVAKACGKFGLRCCSQDDYGAVKAHFLELLGEPGAALKAEVHGRAEANDRRQVEWKIILLLKRLGKTLPYADGICRQMFRGVSLQDATTRGLWGVYFALKKQERRETTV